MHHVSSPSTYHLSHSGQQNQCEQEGLLQSLLVLPLVPEITVYCKMSIFAKGHFSTTRHSDISITSMSVESLVLSLYEYQHHNSLATLPD